MCATEHRFRYRVDIRIPASHLSVRLNELLDWCRENIVSGWWDQHNYLEKRAGRVPIHCAKFYFTSAEDAERFRKRWTN